jgi:hypothetical protein
VTAALRGVADQRAIGAFAPILLIAREASEALSRGFCGTRSDTLTGLISAVESFAREHGLEVIGNPGEVVEYVPLLHTTIDDRRPNDARVRIIKPAIVHRLHDGGSEVLIKAIVAS